MHTSTTQNKMKTIKTITQIRRLFWVKLPEFAYAYRKTYRQNRYNATIRSAFVDFVDSLHRNGEITDSLANRVTL